MSREFQKQIAVKCLEKLNIYKPYIKGFKAERPIPCFYENFAGFWADQEPELLEKIKKVEEDYGCLVYAITHEIFKFGDCWSMLCVYKEAELVEDCLDESGRPGTFYAFAYVWNKTDDWCSEFGEVAVQSFGGGIRRMG
jgi:hypothetical protein